MKESTDAPPDVLQRFAYGYDAAGNRTSEQIDDSITETSVNEVNELVSQIVGGPLRFVGSTNEPATVTIDGQAAATDAANRFRGAAATASGTNTVTVGATDASGNQATQQYEMDLSGSSKTFTYDANGNLTSDGSRTFEWDARNQLVAVTTGTHRSEFTYDGRQQRVRVVDKEDGMVQSDARDIWCHAALCEERDADGVTVGRRLFTDGEQISNAAHFFASDHLGSTTDVTDASSGDLLTRYTFDPWGRRTVSSGSTTTSVGFTGHETHHATGLTLALYRAYDADLGTWVSEDPLGIKGGLDLYSYANDNPVINSDPTGLVSVTIDDPLLQYAPKSAVGGCGKTTARVDLSGGCHCEGGTWKASLSIHLAGTIRIANDTFVTPQRLITWHERSLHWNAYVGSVQRAAGAGARIEAKGYPSQSACESDVSSWKSEWYPKVAQAGAHTIWSAFFWGMTCE